MKYLTLVFLVVSAACSPARISRIGPTMPSRPGNCDVEVLDREEKPSRPYRDVGMVELENCQDYRSPPCRGWLTEAVCEMGGQVAYPSEEERPDSQIGPVTFRMLVAVYVADLRPDIIGAQAAPTEVCDPPCEEGKICKNGQCLAPEDCDEPAPAKDEPSPERCTE